MKLFEPSENISINLSTESFINYLIVSDYIAEEDLKDLFISLRSKFINIKDTIFHTYNDKITYDILSNRVIVLHNLKKIKFIDIAPKLVSKPENFKGFYYDYLVDLNIHLQKQLETVYTTIEKLKYFISYYINEYKSDLFDVNSSLGYFKNIEKEIESSRKVISSYFKANNNSTKAEFKNLFKNFNDIENIYKIIEALDKNNIDSNIKQLEKESQNLSELIDVLIENNIKSRGKLINDEVKKNLTFGTYTTAKQIEYISYLFANIITFYGVFKSITSDIIEFAKRYE